MKRTAGAVWLCGVIALSGCHVNGCWNQDFDHDEPLPNTRVDAAPAPPPADSALPSGERIGVLFGAPHGVAVIDDVYVIDGDDLVSFTNVTNGWARVPIAMNIGPAKGLVASGDWLYWSTAGSSDGAIMRVRVRPQIGVSERVAAITLPVIEGIAVESGVRWLEESGLFASDGDGGSTLVLAANVKPTNAFSPIVHIASVTHFLAVDQLITQADDGGSTTTTVGGASAIVADPFRIFVARSIDGGIEIGRAVDGGFVPFDTTQSARSLAYDGRAIFVANATEHTVREVGLAGGSTVIASTDGAPWDLALVRGDFGGFAFFTTQNPNEIRRIAY